MVAAAAVAAAVAVAAAHERRRPRRRLLSPQKQQQEEEEEEAPEQQVAAMEPGGSSGERTFSVDVSPGVPCELQMYDSGCDGWDGMTWRLRACRLKGANCASRADLVRTHITARILACTGAAASSSSSSMRHGRRPIERRQSRANACLQPLMIDGGDRGDGSSSHCL